MNGLFACLFACSVIDCVFLCLHYMYFICCLCVISGWIVHVYVRVHFRVQQMFLFLL